MIRRRYVRILLVVALFLVPAVVGGLAGPGVVKQAIAEPIYLITTLVSPVGSGSVEAVPGATDYTLTATANTGWHFVDWSGDVAEPNNPVTVTLDTATTVTANFAIDTFTITASAGPNGSISPSGVQTVDYGGAQAFTITPATGYHIATVLVDGTPNPAAVAAGSYTFTNVTANHTISASFAIDTFTITPSAGLHGAILPATPQIVPYGGTQTFTITPSTEYHITGVYVDDVLVGTDPSYTFIDVTANHTISATFGVDAFTITPTAGPNGSITPATPQSVDSGGTQAFTITPATGYHIADVLVDGTSNPAAVASGSHTFTNVTANHTISATFEIDAFTITASAGPNGSITPAGAQGVDYGGDQVFTITPDTGYHVADVLVDGVSVGAVTSYPFTGVAADHTISASFAIDAFLITPSAGLHGFISPATPQGVDYGGSLEFTITPAGGYYIADVLVDGESVGPVTSYSFASVAADHTISASFEPGVQTELWMSTANSVVTYGSSTRLRGELSYADGGLAPVGLGGRTVIVEQAASAIGPWDPLDTRVTSLEPGTLGQFSLTVAPKAPTYYRLRYVKEPLSLYGGSVSTVRKVGMRPFLGRPARPRAVKVRRRFTVYGSLKPQFTAGQKNVKIKVYRYRNGRWRYAKALWATNVDNGSFSKYRLRMRLTAKGKYRFRATSSAAGWATKMSRYSKTLIVK